MDAPDLPQSLEDVALWIARSLSRGAADPKSAFHWPTLISLSEEGGAPQARTVVLRAHDASKRELLFYTDQRSEKCRELEASPAASVHVYEPKKRAQLRLTGTATMETSGPRWEEALKKAITSGSLDYSAQPGPGSPISDVQAFLHDDGTTRNHFTLISFIYQKADYLHLGRERHSRAVTEWTADGPRSSWLVP